MGPYNFLEVWGGVGRGSIIYSETGVGWIGADHNWKKWVGEGMGPEKYIPIGVGLEWGLTIKPLLGWGRDGAGNFFKRTNP